MRKPPATAASRTAVRLIGFSLCLLGQIELPQAGFGQGQLAAGIVGMVATMAGEVREHQIGGGLRIVHAAAGDAIAVPVGLGQIGAQRPCRCRRSRQQQALRRPQPSPSAAAGRAAEVRCSVGQRAPDGRHKQPAGQRSQRTREHTRRNRTANGPQLAVRLPTIAARHGRSSTLRVELPDSESQATSPPGDVAPRAARAMPAANSASPTRPVSSATCR